MFYKHTYSREFEQVRGKLNEKGMHAWALLHKMINAKGVAQPISYFTVWTIKSGKTEYINFY